MSELHSYLEALAGIRAVLNRYAGAPSALPASLELRAEARAVTQAAVAHHVGLETLVADLGCIVAEALPHDPPAAVAVGHALARWTGREHFDAVRPGPAAVA